MKKESTRTQSKNNSKEYVKLKKKVGNIGKKESNPNILKRTVFSLHVKELLDYISGRLQGGPVYSLVQFRRVLAVAGFSVISFRHLV